MNKKEIKELLFIILFSIINITIAFLITSSLGVQNTILFTLHTALVQEINYEVLIFLVLSLIEARVYHFKFESKSE